MLTTFEPNEFLDLPAHRGQRVESFTFELQHAITGQLLGQVHPVRDAEAPQLTHDTTRAIKRQLRITLESADVANVNVLTDRVVPFMHVGGVSYPLGRYIITDTALQHFTYGDRGPYALLDEGLIVDQDLESGFASSDHADAAIADLLRGLPIGPVVMEPTQFNAVGSYAPGTRRGQIIETCAQQGDYFSPWFNHAGAFRAIRTKDPADEIPDFDFDSFNRIHRGTMTFTSDILNAPNKFIVISNSGDAETSEIVGVYVVPPTAPYSVAQRGFAITTTEDLQAESGLQAQAMARNMGIRQTIFERVTFDTPLDPRHDSYNILRLEGSNWLELGWQMTLTPGGVMRHTARKAYRETG